MIYLADYVYEYTQSGIVDRLLEVAKSIPIADDRKENFLNYLTGLPHFIEENRYALQVELGELELEMIEKMDD